MNEKRLIDANALCDLLDVEYKRKMKLVRKGEPHLDTLAEGIISMSVLLGTMPTVDAVEVVRCKDCNFYQETIGKESGKPCGYGSCVNPYAIITGIVYDEDFCSYGERIDND